MSTLSREVGLGAVVVEKWLRDNHNAGHHLEQYHSDKLHGLMMSRIRKLSNQVASGEIEPKRIHSDTLEEIFDSILQSGLLVPENPKVIGEEEKRAVQDAADRAAIDADLGCELFYMQHSSRECEEAAKKNPYFKQWLDSAKYGSQQRADSATASGGAFHCSWNPKGRRFNFCLKRYRRNRSQWTGCLPVRPD